MLDLGKITCTGHADQKRSGKLKHCPKNCEKVHFGKQKNDRK